MTVRQENPVDKNCSTEEVNEICEMMNYTSMQKISLTVTWSNFFFYYCCWIGLPVDWEGKWSFLKLGEDVNRGSLFRTNASYDF